MAADAAYGDGLTTMLQSPGSDAAADECAVECEVLIVKPEAEHFKKVDTSVQLRLGSATAVCSIEFSIERSVECSIERSIESSIECSIDTLLLYNTS